MDKSNPDALKAHVATLPAAAFVIVLAAYAIGTFGGSVVAALIAGRAHLTHALLLGGLLLVLGIVNFVLVPHPAWVVAASVVVYPVAAFLGGTLAARRQRAG
jgi:predicted MFS family arabinose efflux permease